MSTSGSLIGVVLDVGSLDTKAGFAGEAFPRCIVPTVVGRFRRHGMTDGLPDVYFAKEAIRNRGISNLIWPVKDGLVDNWEELEKLWHHVFYKELHVAPEQAQILHAMHPLTPRRQKTSGLVWDNGASCCYASPVFEGFPLKHATVSSQLNGKALSNYLNKLLEKKGYSFTTPTELDILDQIKAKLCYVAKDYDEEVANLAMADESKAIYDLPDGQHVLLGEERFKCPEILFQTSFQGDKHKSVVDDICNSINKCDMDYKHLFFDNIVITGRSSMFPGLPERLKIELSKRVVDLPGIKANVDAMSSRSVAVWAGGSIMASLSTMNDFWVTRDEYEDIGRDCVNHKFF